MSSTAAHDSSLATDILEVRNLCVSFNTPSGTAQAVRDVSFRVRQGETLALVGESGSGKSVTSLGLMRLVPAEPACRLSGEALLRTSGGTVVDLLSAPEAQMRSLRGDRIAMIFQEPMTSLNPVHTVGSQIVEAIRCHRDMSPRAAKTRAAELLDLVGIVDAGKRLEDYPHQMSGGMRQRAMIAMAISCEPTLLIADEPTTALDTTIQAQILQLLQSLKEKTGMAMIFITHNLGVVAQVADRVMVMYAGSVVEQSDVGSLFRRPLMPYTAALMRSVPRLDMIGRRDIMLPAIPGNVPDLMHMPGGCAFEPRCEHRIGGICDATRPELEDAGEGRWVRCARWRDLAASHGKGLSAP